MARPLLLPGLHGNDAMWPWFRAAWHDPIDSVVYPDEPALTLDDYIAHVETAITEPVDLVGESFSGPIALRVAARGRVPVRRVVLVASFAGSLRPRLLPLSRLVPGRLLPHAPRCVIAGLLANGITDGPLVADIVTAVRAIPPAVVASRLRLLAQLDATGLRCTQPVLYLQATRDRLVPPSTLTEIRAVCPELTVTTITAPHLIMQSQPEVAAAAIRAFFAR